MFRIGKKALEDVYGGYMGKGDAAKRVQLMDYHMTHQPALMLYYTVLLQDFEGPYRGLVSFVMLAIAAEHANGRDIPVASCAACMAAAVEYDRLDAREAMGEWEPRYADTQPELLAFLSGTVFPRMGISSDNEEMHLATLWTTLLILRPFEH
jgi:hypothetical protein